MNLTHSGSYSDTLTSQSNCNSISVLNFVVITIPVPRITVVDNCDGTSTLTAINYTGNLLWSNGQTTAVITVNVAGIYSVTQTINSCASVAGSAVASPKLPPVVIAESKEVCEGSSVQLSGAPSGGNWSGTGIIGNVFNAQGLLPGIYSATYTYSQGSCPTTASANIKVKARST